MSSFYEITYENFLSICRCCIMNKGDIDIFEAYMEDLSLSNIIFICTNEMIEKHDGLSRVICNICMQILINSYAFIKTFKASQNSIKTMYKVFENIDSVNESEINSTESSLKQYNGKSKTMSTTHEHLDENLSQGDEHVHIENQKYIGQKCDLEVVECLERSIPFPKDDTYDIISGAKQSQDDDQCLDDISEASRVEISAQEAGDTLRNKGGVNQIKELKLILHLFQV
ncbi:hypothetical protein WA026_013764 [Henosepilachna vigintioctopunctata]|uniref:ZAD domain-containing protein n=1 Tax=Henosepilachna vigintioctopunctata TaxID=420089 RepID=A0AAW1URY2_9CUCU